MSKVIDLLNAAKTKLGASSNYQLAKLSGIPESAICEMFKGKRSASDEALARLALILDKPIGEVLAEVRAEDAKSEKSRGFWRDFLTATEGQKRIGGLAIWSASWWLVFTDGAGELCRMWRYVWSKRGGLTLGTLTNKAAGI